MKLNKFKEMDKKTKGLVISVICVVLLVAIVFIYRCYAIYQEKQELNVIKGSVPEYMDNYDVKLSFSLNGENVLSTPKKGSGNTVESIVCDNETSASWNYEK